MSGHEGLAKLGAGVLAERANTAWMDQALCRLFDPEVWFPVESGNGSKEGRAKYAQKIEDAKAICAICPVRGQCLADVLACGDQYGIRAGLEPHERGVANTAARREAAKAAKQVEKIA